MAYKTFVNGFPLNASELNTFLMNQSVSTFADAAARTAAIATPAEGQLTYLNSDDSYYKYDGTAWVKLTGMSNDLVPISPNYIINGAFDTWQRGTSFTAGSRTYSGDRFTVGRSGNVAGLTASRSTDVPDNFVYSMKVQRDSGNTATNNLELHQQFEDVGKILAGQTVTISFFGKAGANFDGTFSVRQGNSSVAPASVVYSSGGSFSAGNADYEGIGSVISLTTTWTRYSFTTTLADTANALQVLFRYTPTGTAGADDSFYITGIQLEAGSVATPFRRNANSIQGELAACQRYYYKMESAGGLHIDVGYAGSTTAARYALKTPVQMRTTPTLTATNLRIGFGTFSVNTPSAIAIQGYLGNSAEIRATASTTVLTAGQAVLLNTDASLGGSLELSAEL